jgi:hypothetical protein
MRMIVFINLRQIFKTGNPDSSMLIAPAETGLMHHRQL